MKFKKGDYVKSNKGLVSYLVTSVNEENNQFDGVVIVVDESTYLTPGTYVKNCLATKFELSKIPLIPFQQGDTVVSAKGTTVLITDRAKDHFSGVQLNDTTDLIGKGFYSALWNYKEFKHCPIVHPCAFSPGDLVKYEAINLVVAVYGHGALSNGYRGIVVVSGNSSYEKGFISSDWAFVGGYVLTTPEEIQASVFYPSAPAKRAIDVEEEEESVEGRPIFQPGDVLIPFNSNKRFVVTEHDGGHMLKAVRMSDGVLGEFYTSQFKLADPLPGASEFKPGDKVKSVRDGYTVVVTGPGKFSNKFAGVVVAAGKYQDHIIGVYDNDFLKAAYKPIVVDED